MSSPSYDVLIVGGGVMGCATAYHLLARDPAVSIAVVEKDPTYRHASTVLSDGNVRIQFNLEENIRISQYAMDVLETFAEDMAVGDVRPEPAMQRQGNLFTVDAGTRVVAEEGMRLQMQLGCDIRWMSNEEIDETYPPYRSIGLVGGTLGPNDGSVDPNAVLAGYRAKSIELGAAMIEGEAIRLLAKDGRACGAELTTGERLHATVVVNCAGAWASELAETVGVDLPVDPVMRTVFVVETDVGRGLDLPSVFLPSGLYVIPEADGTYLMAWSSDDDPVGFDFTFSRSGFNERIWPELVRHFPEFDRLHVRGGWNGLYAVNTLDGNAILGEWPELGGLYLANGFSGHGFQQCHAVGRYLAESILGLDHELDLSRFGAQRILTGEPVHEHAGRII